MPAHLTGQGSFNCVDGRQSRIVSSARSDSVALLKRAIRHNRRVAPVRLHDGHSGGSGNDRIEFTAIFRPRKVFGKHMFFVILKWLICNSLLGEFSE